jgi:hypothetical protein
VARILDKLLDFFASLKLAIVLIFGLAIYLAAATTYESRYGTRPVQDVVYASRPFVMWMAFLAINVMAAVLVRYPWKRKQTGFIITHAGIEILLLGCLLSFRYSIDGRVSLEPGQKSEVINLNDEEVGVTMPDAGGRQRRHVFPIELWHQAGYPSLSRFLAGSTGLVSVPMEPRWPEGQAVSWPLGGGAKLTVLDWLPAAVPQTVINPTPDGFPAAMIHLGGSLPNGMGMDQTIPIVADGQGDGMIRPFGGMLEMNLWKARSDDEVQEFMNAPAQESLPALGRVDLFLGGKKYAVDVKQENFGKDQTLADSGYKASVEDYTLHAPPPQLPENHGADAMATEPIDPQISLRLTGPNGVRRYLLSAWHPQFMAPLDDANDGGHGAPRPDDPLIWYWSPQTYFTAKGGTLGRLQLLQTPDGRLLARTFALQLPGGAGPMAPFEVQVGREIPHVWLNISFSVTQHVPSGVIVNDFRPAHIEPTQMDQHPRAIKVAIDVDGTHQESWLALGDEPAEVNTARGPVEIDYNYREYELGFSIGLDHAEQTNDPGTETAAAYTSQLTVMGSDKSDGAHIITMNEPLTVQGLTFYQAGFANEQGVAISTLSVRYDPGWILKYIGCGLIVGGIFTMFYMKAYFQKSPVPLAQTASKPNSRPVAASA